MMDPLNRHTWPTSDMNNTSGDTTFSRFSKFHVIRAQYDMDCSEKVATARSTNHTIEEGNCIRSLMVVIMMVVVLVEVMMVVK